MNLLEIFREISSVERVREEVKPNISRVFVLTNYKIHIFRMVRIPVVRLARIILLFTLRLLHDQEIGILSGGIVQVQLGQFRQDDPEG